VPSPTQQEIEVILEQIRDTVGHINVWDCSCFIPGPRTPFVVIDFAVWEDWIRAQSLLEEHGTLSEDMRRLVQVQ